jgi:signal transduction histidine kinase
MTPLRVLFVEDSTDDVALLVRELRRGGYAPEFAQVQTAAEFQAALPRDWQVIISDYTMPGFSGLEALSQLVRSGRDVPFILISGTVGEEVAVAAMKAGAGDYLLKNNLTRLVPAVARELREADGRRQRRAAEAALRESQALLSLIYNHTSDALSLYTAGPGAGWRLSSANTTYVRQACGPRHAVSEADLLGRPVEAILGDLFGCSPAVVAAARARFDDAARTGNTVTYEQEFNLAVGRLFLELTLVPVAETGGSCRHILLAGRDVTARKRAEEEQRRLQAQLAQAQKLEALGTFAGGIAHDFNNVLTAVLGYADLIQRDTHDDERTQTRIESILTATVRAQDLVRQILTFSRKQTPTRKPIRLAAVVEEALKLLRASIPPSLTLWTDVRGDPAVLADAGQMHQVLMNLCTNAIQALEPAGGQLTVALDTVDVDAAFALGHAPLKPGPHVRLTVADTGVGMDAVSLERIFEPFFTTKPPGRGTGLGLAVVHGIVQSHDGAVTVESQPGVGTTFHVYLPATVGPASSVDGDGRPAEPPRGNGELVLLVDDDPGVVRLGEHLLERLGYRVDGYTDPRAALVAFTASPDRYALVLTDLAMPELSGTEVARQVRATRPRMPVVLTSGYLSPSQDRRAGDYGAGEFLGKPFSLKTLAETLAAALQGPE